MFTQGAQTEDVVAFGEALAVFVVKQRTVVEGGLGFAEGAVEQELATGGGEEIGAADDFGDAHRRVIDGAGQLIAGEVVFAPHEEVAEIATGGFGVRAGASVEEGDVRALGNTEAPIHADA